MLWGRIEALADRLEADLFSVVEDLKQFAVTYVNQNPRLPGPLFGLLRSRRPILVTDNVAVVTRHADVREVLSRGDVFTVPFYKEKMEALAGPFILGMGPGAPYDRDSGILDRAIRHEDASWIARIVEDCAREIVQAAAPDGKLDFVAALSDRVAVRIAAEYFGTPGPDERTWAYWARWVFHELFINIDNNPEIREHAEAAAAGMRIAVAQTVAERRAAGAPGDDVVQRLLQMQRGPADSFDDTEIRTNVLGYVVGLIAPVSKAASLALDELLNRPDELAGAQQAARDGNIELVSAYVFEALRFNPHNPGLLRVCAQDFALAQGTERETVIPAGLVTVAATQAAMFDDSVLPDPNAFRLDRPWEHYLHFGYAQHTCGGEQIARVALPRIIAAVLRLKGLRRTAGREGDLQWDGPFPRHLTLEFDPE